MDSSVDNDIRRDRDGNGPDGQWRAQAWMLLARLLARPPGPELLGGLASLEADGGASNADPMAAQLAELADAAVRLGTARIALEFDRLFIGLTRGEVVPYASWYRTGFLHDRPLSQIRQDMRALGLVRAPEVHEPEDHVAALAEIQAGLVSGELGPGSGPDGPLGPASFFRRHLAPWAMAFFADLEAAPSARFYKPLGGFGGLLAEAEGTLLGVPVAPARSRVAARQVSDDADRFERQGHDARSTARS